MSRRQEPQGHRGGSRHARSRRLGFLVPIFAGLVVATTITASAQDSNTDPGPRGGHESASFTGLAQAPEANLFVGAATTGIPIQLPPGRKNLTPQLSLGYNSNGGPSPYGYGWDLTIGRIQRSTSHGVLSCANPDQQEDFVLVLPGHSLEFTRDPNTGTGTPKVEESFLKITSDSINNNWVVWDKSGLKYTFGGTIDSRTGRNPYLFYDNGFCSTSEEYDAAYTYSWGLTRIEDPFGNYVAITYQSGINLNPPDEGDGVAYPAVISYGGNTPNSLSPPFTVEFSWIDRPLEDQIVNSVGGFPAVLRQLLSKIDVKFQGSIVRSYELKYDFQVDQTERIGRQSFLTAVTLYDGSNPPRALSQYDPNIPASTTFLYQEPQPGVYTQGGFGLETFAQLAPVVGSGVVAGRLGGSNGDTRDILDVNGDGIPDLVDTENCAYNKATSNVYAWDVYLGSSSGFSPTKYLWLLDPGGLICQTYGGAIRFKSEVNINSHRRNTFSDTDTIDINGDGIPDYIDTTQWTLQNPTWQVYLGYWTPGGGGFYSPLSWPAPVKQLKHGQAGDLSRLSLNASSSSVDLRELIDINGDGLPDLVEAPDDTTNAPPPWTGSWTVWLNTGAGFDPVGRDFTAHFPMLRYNIGEREVVGIYDMNGDGLPDQVYSQPTGNWQVSINGGYFLQPTEPWTVPTTVQGYTRELASPTTQDVVRQMIDVNGDGLPDIVDSTGWLYPTNQYWQVALNHGSGFSSDSSAVLSWFSPVHMIRKAAVSGTSTATHADMFDIDGDGLPDYVDFFSDPSHVLIYRNLGGAWCSAATTGICGGLSPTFAIPSPTNGRSDLMVQMENGIGGTTSLEYRPSTQWINPGSPWNNTGNNNVPDLPLIMWTVTEIARDDGLCDANGVNCTSKGKHTLVTDFTYQNGLYDWQERMFRGFQYVTSKEAGDATAHRQGRTVKFDQSIQFTGKMVEEDVFDLANGGTFATSPLTKTVNTWECAKTTDGTLLATCIPPPGGVVSVRLNSVARTTFSADLSSKTSTTKNLDFPKCNGNYYGNVGHTQTGSASDSSETHTHTEYACLVDGSHYIVDRPIHTFIKGASDTGSVLDEKWFYYDNQSFGLLLDKGAVTKTEAYLDTVPTRVATQMQYDGFGNIKQVTDPLSRITTTDYDSATQLYPHNVTNALQQRQTMEYDPACGVKVSESIPYRAIDPEPSDRTIYGYDTFCRPSTIYLPDDPTIAYEIYSYTLGGPLNGIQHATMAARLHREATGYSGYTWQFVLADALGRPIQENRSGFVDGAWVTLTATTTEYDAQGNPLTQYAPYSKPHVSGEGGVYLPPAAGAPSTASTFDALHRVKTITHPDTKVRNLNYDVAWQTSTDDECYSDSSCPGSHVTEIRDSLGRVIERDALEEGTGDKLSTLFTYDALGRTTKKTQANAAGPNTITAVVTFYDTLGRKIFVYDPDSGLWSYQYDAVGNLVMQTAPDTSKPSLQICYDPLNRKTQECPLSTPSIQSSCSTLPYNSTCTVYTYGTDDVSPPNGLSRLIRVEEPFGKTYFENYDLRGRVLQERKVISPQEGQPDEEGTTQYAYRAGDHIDQITYPDGEVVSYNYDLAGQVTTLQSVTTGATYLSGATYDAFGRPRVISHGNGTADTYAYYGKEQNFRLEDITTALGANPPLIQYHYADYTATGHLKTLTDNTSYSSVLKNGAGFDYDGFGRLKAASNTSAGTYTYDYDDWGNIRHKDGAAYDYFDNSQPHRLAKINGSSANLGHDNNGNRTQKPGQTYTYDAWNRLTSVSVTSYNIEFRYDYSGWRTVKLINSDPTYYYNRYLEGADGWITKYYYAGDRLIATRRAQFASLAMRTDAPIVVAQSSIQHLALVLMLRRDVQCAVMIAGSALTMGLLVLPMRRRKVIGLAVRHGHVIGVTLAYLLGTFPYPLLVKPAEATCSPEQPAIYHYHLDHLGSTHLISNSSGGVVQYIRYDPYGAIRGPYDANGTVLFQSAAHRHEFTGYDNEYVSLLDYAGARFYDPALAMFLTMDPAGQFANPYTYSGWDPTNLTDPNGALVPLIYAVIYAALVGAAAGFAAGIVQAAVNGASVVQALKAGALGAVVGAFAGAGLSFVGGFVAASASPALQVAFKAATLGWGAYSTVDGIRNGQYAAIGVSILAFSAYSFLSDDSAGADVNVGGNKAINSGTDASGGLQFAENDYGVCGNAEDPNNPDVTLMAKMIFTEGGGQNQTTLEQLGVAARNRVELDTYYHADNYHDILTQYNQFQGLTNPNRAPLFDHPPNPAEAAFKEKTLDIARRVISGEVRSRIADASSFFSGPEPTKYSAAFASGQLNVTARFGDFTFYSGH